LSAERTIFAELYCGERFRKGAAPAARLEKFLTPWGINRLGLAHDFGPQRRSSPADHL